MTVDAELNCRLGLLVRVSAELDMQLRDLALELATPVHFDSRAPSKDELRLRAADGHFVRPFSEVIELARRHAASPLLERDEVYQRRLKLVLDRAEAAYLRRNRYVHDPALPIHPPQLISGGPTHRRIRLDQPDAMEDVDLSDLTALVIEIAMLGRLCTATAMVLLQRRVRHFPADDIPLDVEAPFKTSWAAFESKDTQRMMSAWTDLNARSDGSDPLP